MTVTERTLGVALPAFAAELETALGRQGRFDVAGRIRELPLVDRCRCGDHFCATFYTAPRPEGAYGAGHNTVVVDVTSGTVVLDRVGDEIMCIEVLDGPDVQNALLAILG